VDMDNIMTEQSLIHGLSMSQYQQSGSRPIALVANLLELKIQVSGKVQYFLQEFELCDCSTQGDSTAALIAYHTNGIRGWQQARPTTTASMLVAELWN